MVFGSGDFFVARLYAVSWSPLYSPLLQATQAYTEHAPLSICLDREFIRDLRGVFSAGHEPVGRARISRNTPIERTFPPREST